MRMFVTSTPQGSEHQGNITIDSFYPYVILKWLLNKPLDAFCDMQKLLIQIDEEGMELKVTTGLPNL